eukprot:16452367-Heterocapsa_arctica.AAC.1
MPDCSCITESKSSTRWGADPNGDNNTCVTLMTSWSTSMPGGSVMAASSRTGTLRGGDLDECNLSRLREDELFLLGRVAVQSDVSRARPGAPTPNAVLLLVQLLLVRRGESSPPCSAGGKYQDDAVSQDAVVRDADGGDDFAAEVGGDKLSSNLRRRLALVEPEAEPKDVAEGAGSCCRGDLEASQEECGEGPSREDLCLRRGPCDEVVDAAHPVVAGGRTSVGRVGLPEPSGSGPSLVVVMVICDGEGVFGEHVPGLRVGLLQLLPEEVGQLKGRALGATRDPSKGCPQLQ